MLKMLGTFLIAAGVVKLAIVAIAKRNDTRS
jgi:hypothetical protein